MSNHVKDPFGQCEVCGKVAVIVGKVCKGAVQVQGRKNDVAKVIVLSDFRKLKQNRLEAQLSKVGE